MLELTVRLDEKLVSIKEAQQDSVNKLADAIRHVNAVDSRVTILESKNGGKYHELLAMIHVMDKKMSQTDVQIKMELDSLRMMINSLEKEKKSSINIVGKFVGLLVQAAWVVTVCYILFKLGINSSPIP